MAEAENPDNFNEEPDGDFDTEDGIITMYDDDGNEANYQLLATKEDGGCMYMLAEGMQPNTDEYEAEVFIFKSMAAEEDDEMIFELVDEEHEDFDKSFKLFKDDFESFGIEY